MSEDIRAMSIMAHQDDCEFNLGGTLALLRQTYGVAAEIKILATSRGAAGHHEMNLEETFARRHQEATKSAAVIGASYECLRRLDGSHGPVQVIIDRNLLGGLWNAIRAFEPDVIFCPPVVTDPLAGIHIDHQNTALAVRLVAYQLIVPHAYPTLEGPVKKRVRRPLIINADDVYAGERMWHIRQDIREAYETKVKMGLCHESQIFEWLPFTGGRDEPVTREEWLQTFEKRHLLINQRYGNDDGVCSEYFRVTRWSRAPAEGELERIFPKLMANNYKPES